MQSEKVWEETGTGEGRAIPNYSMGTLQMMETVVTTAAKGKQSGGDCDCDSTAMCEGLEIHDLASQSYTLRV